jgi:hypothetical protein
MFYYDRINDDYTVHQRDHAYLKDELDIVVADAKVKKPDWYQGILDSLGDRLIAIGSSIKERDGELKSITLSPSMR